jgi:hypothetical protein
MRRKLRQAAPGASLAHCQWPGPTGRGGHGPTGTVTDHCRGEHEASESLQRFHRKCIPSRIMCRGPHSPSHSEASHLDRGTGGEAGHPRTHPRHQPEALCSFEGAEIPRACLSYGRTGTGRPDSISPAALLGGGWQALPSSLQVKPRSFTIQLYRSCLTRWGSASLMPLTT